MRFPTSNANAPNTTEQSILFGLPVIRGHNSRFESLLKLSKDVGQGSNHASGVARVRESPVTSYVRNVIAIDSLSALPYSSSWNWIDTEFDSLLGDFIRRAGVQVSRRAIDANSASRAH